MTRREDWPERLIETIERHAALPFGWGISDCFTLPMDCVLAMTDADPWAEVRDTYATERGAAKQLRQRGFETLADAFASKFEEIPPSLAGRGDIGVVDSPDGLAGVVFVDTGAIGKAESGVRRVPRSLVLRAFKV
jgi:hypothetical protein